MAAKKKAARASKPEQTVKKQSDRRAANGKTFHDWETLERSYLEDQTGNLVAWAERNGVKRQTAERHARAKGWRKKWKAAQAKALEIAASAAVDTKVQRITDCIDRDISDGSEMRDVIMAEFRRMVEWRRESNLPVGVDELDKLTRARARCQAMIRLALGLTTDAKGHRLQDSNGEDAPLDRLEVTVTPSRDTSHLVPP